MENHDDNDNLPRYRPNGYKQQIKREIEINDMIIRHQHNYKLENDSQLEEMEIRKKELEILQKELREKVQKMQLEYDERMKQEYEEWKLQPLEDLELELLHSIHTLMEYDNEIYGLKCEIRTLKVIIRSINIQVNETKERKQKVEVAIC